MEIKMENTAIEMEAKGSIAFNKLHFMDTKDVQDLYGYHYKTAQILLRKIRIYYKKKPRSLINLEEFASYTGVSVKMLQKLKKWKN